MYSQGQCSKNYFFNLSLNIVVAVEIYCKKIWDSPLMELVEKFYDHLIFRIYLWWMTAFCVPAVAEYTEEHLTERIPPSCILHRVAWFPATPQKTPAALNCVRFWQAADERGLVLIQLWGLEGFQVVCRVQPLQIKAEEGLAGRGDGPWKW